MELPVLKDIEQNLSIPDRVLHCFLDGGSHDVNEIAAAVGVSRQTVMKSLQFFMRDQLIVVEGKGASGASGGKKPLLYSLSTTLYLLCVTLWNEAFRINLFNIRGDLIDRISLDIPLPETAQAAADNIGQLSAMLLEKNGISLFAVKGVSVSVPGTVDRKANALIYSPPAHFWGPNIPLAEYLQPFFSDSTMIFIESPEKIHTGMYYLEPRYNRTRLVVLAVAHDMVSGCLMENGHILNGTHSLIGELGHMTVDPDDSEECECGSHGCLQKMMSLSRLWRILRREGASFPDSPLLQGKAMPSYREILTAARDGDGLALLCEDYMAKQLSVLLHNLSVFFDPDYVIFAGKDFPVSSAFIGKLYSRISSFRFFQNGVKPFEILFDDVDLIERDAIGSMLTLRWRLLRSADAYLHLDSEGFLYPGPA